MTAPDQYQGFNIADALRHYLDTHGGSAPIEEAIRAIWEGGVELPDSDRPAAVRSFGHNVRILISQPHNKLIFHWNRETDVLSLVEK